MSRPRRSPWVFLQISALTAATLRLEGRAGDAARLEMNFLLEDEYDAAGFCPTQSSGVAALAPDGLVVAVYYAPNAPRNTATDYRAYCIQHRIVAREVLVPLRRQSANDLNPDAYLPAAARGRET